MTPPEQAPDEPQDLEIEFEQGVPVALDGERLGLVELIERTAEIAGRHGVGIVDHIEDRIVGLKVRDVYEVPAATVILTAHQELEKLVGTIHQNNFKPELDRQWAFLVYAGLWYEPLMGDLNAFMDSVNHWVTGKIVMRLYKGHASGGRALVAARALRRGAGRVRRVGRPLQPAGDARVHRAVVAPEPDGLSGEEPRERGIRSRMFYRAIGYAVWKLAMRYLRDRYGGFVKPGAAAATAVGADRGVRRHARRRRVAPTALAGAASTLIA